MLLWPGRRWWSYWAPGVTPIDERSSVGQSQIQDTRVLFFQHACRGPRSRRGGVAALAAPLSEKDSTMAREPFLLTRLDSDIPHRSDISTRLREHLMRLRGHEIDDTVEIWDDTTGAVSEHDVTRIHRRATAYVERIRAASGTAHLKPDEKARLAEIK